MENNKDELTSGESAKPQGLRHDKNRAKQTLSDVLKDGDTVYVQLWKRTEQSAWYRVYTINNNRIVDITWSTAKVLGMCCKDNINQFLMYGGHIGYSVKQYVGEELAKALGFKQLYHESL